MNTDLEYGFTNWVAGTQKDTLAVFIDFVGASSVNVLIYVDDTVQPIRMYLDDSEPPATGSTFPTVVLNSDFSTKQP